MFFYHHHFVLQCQNTGWKSIDIPIKKEEKKELPTTNGFLERKKCKKSRSALSIRCNDLVFLNENFNKAGKKWLGYLILALHMIGLSKHQKNKELHLHEERIGRFLYEILYTISADKYVNLTNTLLWYDMQTFGFCSLESELKS